MAAATRETSFANENYEDVYLPTYTEAIGVASVSPNQPPPLYGSNPSLVSSTTSQLSPPSYDDAIINGDSSAEALPTASAGLASSTECASNNEPRNNNRDNANSFLESNSRVWSTNPCPGSYRPPRPPMPPKYSRTPQAGEYSLRVAPRTSRVLPASSDNRLPRSFNGIEGSRCTSNEEGPEVEYSSCSACMQRKKRDCCVVGVSFLAIALIVIIFVVFLYTKVFAVDKSTDSCTSSPCLNGGTCEKQNDNSYSCTCDNSHYGINCQSPNGCLSNPCHNGGECTTDSSSSSSSAYFCNCAYGYSGKTCDNYFSASKIDCANKPCQNGATCSRVGSQDICTCTSGFTGVSCEKQLDACSSNPCKNGGTCLNLSNIGYTSGYTCKCLKKNSGNNCEY